MSDAPENREPFAVPLDELEAETLAHYEDAASALGEWVNTIPRAIREHFARRRADTVTPTVHLDGDAPVMDAPATEGRARVRTVVVSPTVTPEVEAALEAIMDGVPKKSRAAYFIRDTLRALAAERDNYRESMGRLASLAKGLAAERDALRARVDERHQGEAMSDDTLAYEVKVWKLHRDFSRWAKITQDEDGAWSITCRKGLWGVHGIDFDAVYDEARHYFSRYHDDGEYTYE